MPRERQAIQSTQILCGQEMNCRIPKSKEMYNEELRLCVSRKIVLVHLFEISKTDVGANGLAGWQVIYTPF